MITINDADDMTRKARDIIADALESFPGTVWKPYDMADRILTRLFDSGYDLVPHDWRKKWGKGNG
jgi:hypothetical protein